MSGVRDEDVKHCLLSVIVPVYNELDFISESLGSIMSASEGMDAEVLVIDGGSTDGTLAIIEEFLSEHSNLRVIHNPRTKQVFGLNLGIAAARGRYIVRCDAHSHYPVSYFRNLVGFLAVAPSGYGNVGVMYETRNLATGIRRGIAEAMRSRIGVGGSHRVARSLESPEEVDTVLFGAWPAEVFSEVGLFDERYVRGQDYEHNTRLRKAGRVVAQIPGEPFQYFTRNSFKKLASMIRQYAYVKGQLLAATGKPPNVRSVAPVACLLLAISLVPFPRLFAAAVLGYACVVISAAVACAYSSGRIATAVGFALAVPTMHVAHAFGFISGFARTLSGHASNSMESTR